MSSSSTIIPVNVGILFSFFPRSVGYHTVGLSAAAGTFVTNSRQRKLLWWRRTTSKLFQNFQNFQNKSISVGEMCQTEVKGELFKLRIVRAHDNWPYSVRVPVNKNFYSLEISCKNVRNM